MLARLRAQRLRHLASAPPPGASTSTKNRAAEVERPTMATGGGELDGPGQAPRSEGKRRARPSHKRRAKQGLGKERLPHELPGRIVYREPDWCTPHTHAMANMLLPWMEPTADFPSDKCKALRAAIVPRLERIEMANFHTIMAMRSAVEVEVEVATANPGRHPGGSTTGLVRYLNAYAIEVEGTRSRRLVVADDDVYYEFAQHVGRLIITDSESGSEGDEPPPPPPQPAPPAPSAPTASTHPSAPTPQPSIDDQLQCMFQQHQQDRRNANGSRRSGSRRGRPCVAAAGGAGEIAAAGAAFPPYP